MGGRVARYFTAVLGGSSEGRTTITLGTPYYGAVKAAVILNSGRGAPVPLPSRRLRTLAATLRRGVRPAAVVRCVDEDTSVRRLTPADAAGLGGHADLAEQAFAGRDMLLSGGRNLPASVGVEQRRSEHAAARRRVQPSTT